MIKELLLLLLLQTTRPWFMPPVTISYYQLLSVTSRLRSGNPPLVYAIVNKRDEVREVLLNNSAGPALYTHVQEVKS